MKVKEDKANKEGNAQRERKACKERKRVDDREGVKRYIVVGSKSWNECYLEYEWNGHEFGKKRKQSLPEFMNTVEKRREVQRNKFFTMFDHKVAEGRLSDVIQSSLGYAPTYYHTMDENMYKEWMNEKRTKKDFHIHKDDNERRRWVCLSDGKNEEEMESLNLMMDKSGEFNEVTKKHILYGKHDYSQCFITITAYNLMWTQDEELKILNLTDDRLGYLRVIHKDRIDDWLHDYLKWYRNGVEEQETEGSGYVYNGWIEFHIEMFPLQIFVDYKHPTPSILGRSVINPNIDDNRYLQRCLILASECGHKIIANHKMGDVSVYNKWWKQPNKYKVFGVTIHEIEEAMDICVNKPFKQSEEKFSRLEELLNISLNVFEVTLLPE